MIYGDRGSCAGANQPGDQCVQEAKDRYFFIIINIDAQDNQDGTLLHEKQAPAMIARGFADAQDNELAVA